MDQFHGVEIEEWPAQIARVAMWLMDHQMNVLVSQEFGNALVRVPLVKTANIVNADALTLDWAMVLPSAQCSYLLGNPPFRGARVMSAAQKASAAVALRGVNDSNNLDLVSGWYVKAARYLSPTARAALVSTNSITQGEQVGTLWSWMLAHGIHIQFAHRTFKWQNEASGQAAVHCVIIGFARFPADKRRLFDYDSLTSDPHEIAAANINPYLVDADNILLSKRTSPISPGVSHMEFGSMPNDGGFLLLTDAERKEFVKAEPTARQWLRKFVGSIEFISGKHRWCLWLKDCEPNVLRTMPLVARRVAACRDARLESTRAATRDLADFPALFGEDRQPDEKYLLVPGVSSERRPIIPIGFMDSKVIASNLVYVVSGATLYEFGVISSRMHMAWVASVCGRMKSDYRYSAGIVYNNFPWPEGVTPKQRQDIEAAAKAVLDVRSVHTGSTLADMYDHDAMPGDLVHAHRALDKAVEAAYGRKVFKSDADRVAYLLTKYRDLNDTLQLAVAAKTAARTRAPAKKAVVKKSG